MIAIDTNVLIYAVDTSETEKSRKAVELLDGLVAAGESIILPWHVAAEFLACLRKWINAKRISWSDADAYLARFVGPLPLVTPTPRILSLSLNVSQRYSLSHWDSMLIAACLEAEATRLYTEDLDPGMTYDAVQVINPFVP